MDDKHTKETLHRLESKVDKALEHIAKIDVTLEKQHGSIVHHIKRTDLLEKQLQPMTKHVHGVQAVLKFIMWVTASAFVLTIGAKLWALLVL